MEHTNNNSIDAINEQLMLQLKRLNNGCTGQVLGNEIGRASAMAGLANTIVQGKKLQLDAIKLMASNKQADGNLQGILPGPKE
jgi:hypothetical protein